MDTSLIGQFLLPQSISPIYQNIIPYLILLINFILFKLLRSLSSALLSTSDADNQREPNKSHQPEGVKRLLRLLTSELISTCELCADCAELNVVYEKHGGFAYAAGLFLLTYLWMDAFGDAQTSPGYLAEHIFIGTGGEQHPSSVLTSGETYARFLGQSMALPLAWRFASFYWKYHLLVEHKQMLAVEDCKTALTTSTLSGFLIEFGCCLLCRLIELIGHKLLERRACSKRLVSLSVSFACTLLVMLALELSGGYFNPILAASLEYGCKGIYVYQHAIVFWLGPLLGHVMARLAYKKFAETDERQQEVGQHRQAKESKETTSSPNKSASRPADDGRPRRTTSQRRKRHRD